MFLKHRLLNTLFSCLLMASLDCTIAHGATIDLFTRDAQGDLQISSAPFTMLTNSQVQPDPDIFTDGRIHVALGAPEISISFNGVSFGPIMGTVSGSNASITLSSFPLPTSSPRASEDRADVVPIVQIPFEPFDIPQSTVGGVGRIFTPAFQFPPLPNQTNSLGVVTVTLSGNVDLQDLDNPGVPGEFPQGTNVAQTPIPGAVWLYLTGLTAFGFLQRLFKRQESSPKSLSSTAGLRNKKSCNNV